MPSILSSFSSSFSSSISTSGQSRSHSNSGSSNESLNSSCSWVSSEKHFVTSNTSNTIPISTDSDSNSTLNLQLSSSTRTLPPPNPTSFQNSMISHDGLLPLPLPPTAERRFTILKEVGDGSFGTVWLADWHSELNIPYGTIPPGPSSRPEYKDKNLVALKRMKKAFEGGWEECLKLKELKVGSGPFFFSSLWRYRTSRVGGEKTCWTSYCITWIQTQTSRCHPRPQLSFHFFAVNSSAQPKLANTSPCSKLP
jgi:hypothetical protein